MPRTGLGPPPCPHRRADGGCAAAQLCIPGGRGRPTSAGRTRRATTLGRGRQAPAARRAVVAAWAGRESAFRSRCVAPVTRAIDCWCFRRPSDARRCAGARAVEPPDTSPAPVRRRRSVWVPGGNRRAQGIQQWPPTSWASIRYLLLRTLAGVKLRPPRANFARGHAAGLPLMRCRAKPSRCESFPPLTSVCHADWR